MYVKRELCIDDLSDFLWSNAKSRWLNATDDQREAVWERLEACFEDDVPLEEVVNSVVWFDCDDIFYPDEDLEDDEE